MIEGLNVIISEATIDALIEHQCYRSAGSDWLAKHDPRCKYEQLILDYVFRYFNKDVEVAAEKLSLEQYDKFYEKFDGLQVIFNFTGTYFFERRPVRVLYYVD